MISLHDPFNPWALTAPEVVPLLMASPDFSPSKQELEAGTRAETMAGEGGRTDTACQLGPPG